MPGSHPLPHVLSIAVITLLAAAAPHLSAAARHQANTAVARCSLAPLPTHAVVRVERDTLLPYGGERPEALMGASEAPDAASVLATAGTPLPAARVRVLALDSATRSQLLAEGIRDSQPTVFMRAAPYGADCRTLRWTDTVPFAVVGEVGYVRGTVAPRELWVGDVPLLIIPQSWYYPYPRRGRPAGAMDSASLAPPGAMFEVQQLLDIARFSTLPSASERDAAMRARAARVIAWAREHPATAELEPVRSDIRLAIVDADWMVVQRTPSRMRGTYRVDVEANGVPHRWYFRTQPQPAYRWSGADAKRTTASWVASPHIDGYQLVGDADVSLATLDSAVAARRYRRESRGLAWLGVNDRPTTSGNDARRELASSFEFMLLAAPEASWDALETFVPPMSVRDSTMLSTMLAQMGRTRPRSDRQPRFALTMRIGPDGSVRADSTFVRAGRSVRITLTRLDTVTVPRRF